MLHFIFRRLAIMGPMVLLVLTISFFMIRLAPGSPFSREGRQLPEATIKNLNEKYGLDAPLYRQYLNWISRALHFDFGPSLIYPDSSVNEIIGESLTTSAWIGLAAYLLALIFGLGSGILAALKPNSWVDYLSSSIAILGVSVPNFILGPLLVIIFPLTLYWLPPARLAWAAVIGPLNLHWLIVILSLLLFTIYCILAFYLISSLLARLLNLVLKNSRVASSVSLAVTGVIALLFFGFVARPFLHWEGINFPLVIKLPTLRSTVLPAVTLAAVYIAYISRLTREGMTESLQQDYIRTARAKGLSNWRVIMVHALRGSLLPVVSFTGPALAFLVGGTVVVEKIFAIPGMGSYFINAALNRDYFLLLGITAFVATLLMIMNLLADIAYAALDPRIRY